MKKSHLLVVAVFLLSGCAGQSVWINPSKNHEEAQKDFRECQYDSQKSSYTPYGDGRSPISAGIQEGFQSVTLMNQCMRSRGYYLTNKSELESKKANNLGNYNSYQAARKSKNYEQALEITTVLINDNPNNSTIYTLRGHVYYDLGKYKDAISAYDKAIALDDKNMNAISMKAICFAEIGEYDIAVELANHAINIKNTDSSLFNNRAAVYNKKGDFDKAIEDCNKSIAFNSSVPNGYRQKGLAYLGKGLYEKSIVEFNKAIAIESTYDKAYTDRGEAYLKLGKLEVAMSDFKKACEYGNKDACIKQATLKK